jgi:hypothetical protein
MKITSILGYSTQQNYHSSDKTIKFFQDKETLKQYMTTKPPLQRFSKEFCTQKMKANKTKKGQAIPNHRSRKGKKVKSNTDSATHN